MSEEKDAGYVIHDKDDKHVFEITDDQAFQAYQSGIGDEKNWNRHPVTNELKKFATTHRKHQQVFVQFKDTYNKIR